MRCLTVHRPWAGCFFRSRFAKDVENRGRITHVRGPLLIHAGLAYDDRAQVFIYRITRDNPPENAGGFILGKVELWDCVPPTNVESFDPPLPCSPWHEHGAWGWRVRNPVRFQEPIPYKGSQGFYDVPTYVYVWGNNEKRLGLKGRECVVLKRMKKNSVAVIFLDDGHMEITSRNALRRSRT